MQQGEDTTPNFLSFILIILTLDLKFLLIFSNTIPPLDYYYIYRFIGFFASSTTAANSIRQKLCDMLLFNRTCLAFYLAFF